MMDVTMKNDSLILRSDNDGIAVLTLNSPKSINALSEAMLTAMSDPGRHRGGPHRKGCDPAQRR
jgi:hypothetical protein